VLAFEAENDGASEGDVEESGLDLETGIINLGASKTDGAPVGLLLTDASLVRSPRRFQC
jgi:hypothetical protein